jgi:hypothetical protein
MRKTIWASTFAIAAFSLTGQARAEANLHDGDVLRPGSNMIYPEAGFPELAFGWQHGVSNTVDVGIRASLIYGFEYIPVYAGELGLGVRVPIRITPLKTGKVSLQIHVDPGIKFDSFGTGYGCVLYVGGVCQGGYGYGFGGLFGGGLHFGLWVPVGVDVGIHINQNMTITPGVEIPIFINFTGFVYGAIPILVGAHFQYNINDRMSVGGTLKLGPTILSYTPPGCVAGPFNVCGSFTGATLGLIASGFFAYAF